MESINGLLILSPEEKAAIESAIGPITSYEAKDIKLKLINEIEKKEAVGHVLWAQILRRTLEDINVFVGSNA